MHIKAHGYYTFKIRKSINTDSELYFLIYKLMLKKYISKVINCQSSFYNKRDI